MKIFVVKKFICFNFSVKFFSEPKRILCWFPQKPKGNKQTAILLKGKRVSHTLFAEEIFHLSSYVVS